MVDNNCQNTFHKRISVNVSSYGDFISTNETNMRNETTTPHIKIIEQPAPKALRFRYECEGRSAGSIPGVNSTTENKTHPAIQIANYKGRAVIVVSCVTKDPPYRPHPHNLVGKDGCKRGICTLELNNDTMIASFSNLGIQCVKKKDIEDALRIREEIRVDPFRTGFSHRSQPNSIDLNAVRLCFQAFLDGSERGKFDVLTPVVSEPIYDKKAMSDLCICKLSDSSASVIGGKEIILLCEKVAKDDIQVRFYEESSGQIVWDSCGDFSPQQVHKQVAIVFRTPRYKKPQVDRRVNVFIQLRRPSDGATSESLPFHLTPLDTDPDYMKRKRRMYSTGNELRYLHEFPNIYVDPQYQQQHQYNITTTIAAAITTTVVSPTTSTTTSCTSAVTAIPANNLYNKFLTDGYGSRTPSPLDYQLTPICNNATSVLGGGVSHMSGGTMLYTPINEYAPILPSNNLARPNPRIESVISGLANNGDILQGSQVVTTEGIPVFSHNFNIANAQNNNQDNHLKEEEIGSNIISMSNQQDNMGSSLSRIDSKDLIDAGNLSENLSNCLILSDTKAPPCSSKSNGESMTDSLTKLTNKTLNDLCTLNQMYQEKS